MKDKKNYYKELKSKCLSELLIRFFDTMMFDLETTIGLYKYITEIGWVNFNWRTCKSSSSVSHLVKFSTQDIDDREPSFLQFNKNQITEDLCNSQGIDLKKVFDHFYIDLQKVKTICGYNFHFDLQCLLRDLKKCERFDIIEELKKKTIIDVGRQYAKEYMKQNHDTGLWNVELVHGKLFNHQIESHRAVEDCHMQIKILKEIPDKIKYSYKNLVFKPKYYFIDKDDKTGQLKMKNCERRQEQKIMNQKYNSNINHYGEIYYFNDSNCVYRCDYTYDGTSKISPRLINKDPQTILSPLQQENQRKIIQSTKTIENLNIQKTSDNGKQKLLYYRIGEELNLPMWYKQENKKKDSNYYTFKALLDRFPPLIVVQRYGSYDRTSLYTLNLKTLNPTKNSPIQDILSKELKKDIKKEFEYINLYQ